MPWLVQDVIAARHAVDRLHDSGEANTHGLYVVGVGQGAQVAALWLLTEAIRKDEQAGRPRPIKDVRGAAFVATAPLDGPWSFRARFYSLYPKVRPLPPLLSVTDGRENHGAALAVLVGQNRSPEQLAAEADGPVSHTVLKNPATVKRLVEAIGTASAGQKAWAVRGYHERSYTWELGIIRQPMKPSGEEVPRLFRLEDLGFSFIKK
jgi:hypothetical protein